MDAIQPVFSLKKTWICIIIWTAQAFLNRGYKHMEAVITALTAIVTPTAIWAVVASLATFVGALVLVSLGLHFLRRSVNGASKGKAKF
jgi:hypothetical protein